MLNILATSFMTATRVDPWSQAAPRRDSVPMFDWTGLRHLRWWQAGR